MPIRSLLIDDEHLAIAELQHMLEKHPDISIAGTAQNWEAALQAIEREKPDLIFLDISMPEKNGFELLDMLDEAPYVIFVTAYDQFAIRAFEVNALDYLLKPVNPARLDEALQKVSKFLNPPLEKATPLPLNRRIFIKDGEDCFFVALSQIIMLESAGNYVKVFFENKRPLLHRSLNYMETRLPAENFFRASRQYMINTDYIGAITPWHNHTLRLTMTNGMVVDISQRQSVRFKEIMGI